MSEKLLIQHCAPTLAGIKTGNLFSCSYGDKAQVIASISRLNQKLVPKGLRIVPLQFSQQRVLIYVYRPACLAADFSSQEARSLLEEAGYCPEKADGCVRELIRRLDTQACFPHEIGLFLGYPPEDVHGFIHNNACGYQCVGCWKVYGDVQQAQKRFEEYRRCTRCLVSQWARGIAVERLAVAV